MKTLDPKYIPILEEKYGRYWWPVEYPEEVSTDPFKNLIITVLSQNTSEINCVRAYKGLSSKFEVKPEVLARAKIEDIRLSIGSDGLYNVKSKRSFLKQYWKSLEETYLRFLPCPKKKLGKGLWNFLELAGKPLMFCLRIGIHMLKLWLWTLTWKE
ncbi:MAG: hypothetical protein QMD13_02430 [Candidatus Bathyarchaeia archaeon]|nr:hypothetical protein [Candidatus Bathyarchaeia archaeon]